jgi:hypothetical protein
MKPITIREERQNYENFSNSANGEQFEDTIREWLNSGLFRIEY